jgi:hypothetical protein
MFGRIRSTAVANVEKITMGNTQAQLPCRSVVWSGVPRSASWLAERNGRMTQAAAGAKGCSARGEFKGAGDDKRSTSGDLQSSWLWLLPAVAELKFKQPNPARQNG